MGFFQQLLSSDFMPHGFCYRWDPRIVWLHVISDSLIALSYYYIPLIFVYFIRKNRDLPFNRIFWMFGAFILACGTTHGMEIWNVWHGSYLLAGIIKALTAAVSVLTAAMLIPLVPMVMALRDRAHLQEMNRNLKREIAECKRLDAPIEGPLRRRVTGSFIVAMLLTIFIGFSSWRSVRLAADDADWVAHTFAVLDTIELMSKHLIEAETSARAFALSGQNPLLAHYENARGAIAQDEDALRRLTGDNPNQQRRLDVIEPQIRAALEFAEIVVAQRRQSLIAPSADEITQAESLMNAVHATGHEMKAEEIRLLSQRTQSATEGRRLTRFIIILGPLVGVSLLALARLAVNREMDAAARARTQISTLNADLEQRVQQRTAALQSEVAERKQAEERLAGQAEELSRQADELAGSRQALEAQALTLRSVLDSMAEGLVAADERGKFVIWNTAAERILGMGATNLPSREWTQHYGLFLPDTVTPFPNDRLPMILAIQGEASTSEMFVRNNAITGGAWIEASGSPRKDKDGLLRGGVVAFRDITDRKRAAKALHESQERFRLLLDGVKDYAIYMLDPEGRVISWNEGATRIKGYRSEEILGKHFSCFYLPEDRADDKPSRELRESVSKGRFEGQAQRVRKDGSAFWADIVITPVYDDSGTLRGFSKIARDITERKQAEEQRVGQAEELARSQQALETQALMLQSVLGSMGEGLIAVDNQGKFLLWNTAAEKMLGQEDPNVAIEDWPERFGLYLPDTATLFPSAQLPVVRALNGEVSASEMFVRNRALPEGAWIEVSGGPRTDTNGVACGGVVALRNITQRKADEREIRKLNDELETRVMERTAELEVANKELESFSYSVSHDLRAPLRHVSGFSQMLMEEFGPTLDPGARHYLDRIQSGTQKMGLLVDELLNLARVGRHALHRQPTRLTSIVGEVLAILQPECEGRQVEWVIAELPAVECDPVLVKQVFQNLIANALKFTRPRERAVIEVSHKEEQGQQVFMVRDNGVGFSMKYVDKLFGVFQRLHQAQDFEGTGIGLATVQRIVQKHGGRVWAEGELDKGAAFYFTLGVGKQAESKTNGATAGGQS